MPTGKAVVRLRDLAQRMFVSDPTQLFRRYFINTLFDSTFVVLGILAATALSAEADVDLALGALFAASLAMGISTGVSVYEAEHTEGELRMRRLERAMLSPLKDTDVGREIRFARYAVSLVNFLAPLVVAAITSTPILLFRAGLLPDLATAASLSGALGVGIIFGTGYFLGGLTGRHPWKKAVRMSAVALLTFGALVLLERVL